MLKNNRIDTIVNLINNKEAVIADVGSDHAFLAIKLLQQHRVKHVYNIEINELPLNNTITNLQKHSLLSQTTNVINDGLNNWKLTDHFNYVTISGMGAKTIADIIKNKPISLKVDHFIVVPNNNAHILRKLFTDNKYSIIHESIIYENGYYYELIECSTNPNEGLVISNEKDIYFGPVNLKENTELFKKKNIARYNYINNESILKFNSSLKKGRDILHEWIQKNNN